MGFYEVVDFLNSIIWSTPLVVLCLLTGVYFSIRLKFPQVRLIKDMVKYLFASDDSAEGVSSFQSFAMALGGRVGTGNIAGVATAIGSGGPGAIFWMWAIAFLGSGSAYIEAALAQVYKEEIDGEYRGGPSFYIEKGMGAKWFAVIFSIAALIGVWLFLPGVQSNTIASGLHEAFNIPTYVSGALIIVLLALIVFGGVKRIADVAGIVVPVMAVVYIILATVMIIMNFSEIPRIFSLIISNAFSTSAVYGAIIGKAVEWGVKRGIYSNEAGQGTGPIAAAAAEVSHPAKQGLVQAFSVYVDTLFVCSATAFMILITDAYNVIGPDGPLHKAFGGTGIKVIADGTEKLSAGGPEFTLHAIDAFIPGFGNTFVAIALFFFAFTTILAYAYYSDSTIAYLFDESPYYKQIQLASKIIFMAMVFYGATNTGKGAWGLGDIGVGLMAWTNIIAILFLGNVGVKTLQDYERQKALGVDPVFRPKELGIKGADFWDNYKVK